MKTEGKVIQHANKTKQNEKNRAVFLNCLIAICPQRVPEFKFPNKNRV